MLLRNWLCFNSVVFLLFQEVSTRAHCQEEPTYFDSLKKRVQFCEAAYFGNTHVLIYQALRDCAIIIRRGAEKLGGALHKIAAKIGGAHSKITHLTEGGP